MLWVRRIVIVLGVLLAGYMVVDGAYALIFGDYITPKSGPFAGELGPWQYVVAAVGIAPRSLPMKGIFVVYGLLWLVVIYQYAKGLLWGRALMILLVIGSLWWIGAPTAFALPQLLLLILLPPNRPAALEPTP